MVEGLQQELAAKKAAVQQRDHYILVLEELLRWKRIQQFGASSEKSAHQIHLFDEAELEVEIDALRDQLPDDVKEDEAPPASRKRRQRGFSDKLLRERIELTLSDEDKVGASKTFFTKVKEELQFIPAQLKVLEYWQKKPCSSRMVKSASWQPPARFIHWANARPPRHCWLTSLPQNTPMACHCIV
ncbi:transposase [Marinobacter sp. M1C]|nr:transposase [Marinobacter sp. M1C]